MTKEEQAVDIFKQGYACAQAVAGAFCEELGLSLEKALEISCAFGAGFSLNRNTCEMCIRDRIMKAQSARGAGFSGGGLIKKAKAVIPIIIPLFVLSLIHISAGKTACFCVSLYRRRGSQNLPRLPLKQPNY